MEVTETTPGPPRGMAQEDSMKRHTEIALAVAVLTAGVVFGSSSARGDETSEPPKPALAGRWKLNPELSEDARAKMREAMETARGGGSGGGYGGGGYGGGGRGGGGRGGHGSGGMGGGSRGSRSGTGGDPREAMREILEAPAELAITPTESEVVILEKDGRLRTLHPDGNKYKSEGGAAEVQSRWDGAKLVVETKNEKGPRITETFEAAPDPARLTVTLKLDGSRGPTVTVKRVYDPAETSTGP